MDANKPIMEVRWMGFQGVPETHKSFCLEEKEELLAGSIDLDETIVKYVRIHPEHLDLFRLVNPDTEVIIDLPHGRVDSIVEGLVLHARSHLCLKFYGDEESFVQSIVGIEYLDKLEFLTIKTEGNIDLTPLQMIKSLRTLTLVGLNCEELDLSYLSPSVKIFLFGALVVCGVDSLRLSTGTPYVKISGLHVRTIVAVEDPPAGDSPIVLPMIETESADLFHLSSSKPSIPVVIDKLVFTPHHGHLGQLTEKRVHARHIQMKLSRSTPDLLSLEGITTEYLRSLTILSVARNKTIEGFEFLDTARHLVRVKLAHRNTNIQNFLAWGESRGFVLQEPGPRPSTYRVFVRTVDDDSGDVESS